MQWLAFNVSDGRQPIETVIDEFYDIELTPPDISSYKKGNIGLDYVTTLDGGRPGPHIVVNALTHGNEYCGTVTVTVGSCGW